MKKIKKYLFIALVLVLMLLLPQMVRADQSWVLGCPLLSEEDAQRRLAGTSLCEPEGRLLWNNHPLPYDGLSGSYGLPQRAGTEEWEGNLQWEDRSGEIHRLYAVGENWSDKERSIREALPLKVCAVARDSRAELTLVATGLPMMELHTETAAAEQEEDSLGELRLFWPDSESREQQYTHSRAVYHVRGFSSLSYDKKNFRLTLKDRNGGSRNENLLGLRDDDDWKLYSMALDPTLIREKLANDLWNQLAAENGSPTGNQMEFLELYKDGEYAGVYMLAPRLDRKTYQLGPDGRLYKYARIVDLWAPYALNTFDNKGIINWDDRVKVLWPREPVEGIWGPLNQYFGQFFYKNGKHATMEEGIAMTDLTNLVETALFKQAVSSVDCGKGYNMMYLQYAPGEKLYRIPYDIDRVFGIGDEFTEEAYVENIVEDLELRALLRLDPELAQEEISRGWSHLRGGAFEQDAFAERWHSLQEEVLHTGGVAHNCSRWGGTVGETLAESEQLLSWHQEHLRYLDDYVQAYQPPATED